MPREPLDSPLLAEFVAALDRINALADRHPGFVWRLQTEEGNATSIKAFDDDRLIVNMSVWESIDALADFVYRSGHIEVLRRRRDWFERLKPHTALWWTPAGQIPSLQDAEQRLAHLRDHGPTALAFTFTSRHPPGSGSSPSPQTASAVSSSPRSAATVRVAEACD